MKIKIKMFVDTGCRIVGSRTLPKLLPCLWLVQGRAIPPSLTITLLTNCKFEETAMHVVTHENVKDSMKHYRTRNP